MLLAHQLVDLVVEIADAEVGERGVLDLGDLARDLGEDLTAPFFARGDAVDGGDELGAAGAAEVDYCGLLLEEVDGRGDLGGHVRPRSAAWASRKRKSMDCAFSELRAMVGEDL